MQLGMVGLGRMGNYMVQRLMRHGLLRKLRLALVCILMHALA